MEMLWISLVKQIVSHQSASWNNENKRSRVRKFIRHLNKFSRLCTAKMKTVVGAEITRVMKRLVPSKHYVWYSVDTYRATNFGLGSTLLLFIIVILLCKRHYLYRPGFSSFLLQSSIRPCTTKHTYLIIQFSMSCCCIQGYYRKR